MIDIAILRAMVAAGASVETILAAIEADQAAERVRVQARRDADAARQRRRRGVTPRHADTAGHTVTLRDTADSNGSLSSSLTSTQTSEIIEEKKESKKERPRRNTKSLLPDDWAPKPAHYAKGDRGFVDRKADDMRNWAKSKAVMRADWDATFHGFLRPDDRGKGNGKINGHGNPTMDAFDDLIARSDGGTIEGGVETIDITPGRA